MQGPSEASATHHERQAEMPVAKSNAPSAMRPLEEEVPPGQPGPGLRPRQGVDPTIVTGAAFVVLGFTPVAWWERVFNAGHFGPIQLPAIVAMVGVLFALIALLRSIDLHDRRLRMAAVIVLAAGLVRLFIVPLAA